MLIRPSRRVLLTGAAALAMYARLSPHAHAGVTPTTLNPADKSAQITLSNGNLTFSGGTTTGIGVRSTSSASTGKFYLEVSWSTQAGGGAGIGLSPAAISFANIESNATSSIVYFGSAATPNVFKNGSTFTTIQTFTQGDNIAFAFDIGGGLAWWKNLTTASNWNNSGTANPATGVGGLSFSGLSLPLFVVVTNSANNGTLTGTINFGSTSFAGSVPAGFTAGFGPVSSAGAQDLALVGIE